MASSTPSFLNKMVRKMSTKQSTHSRTDSIDFERPRATTLDVNLLKVISGSEHDDYSEATSTNTEQSKVVRMGIDLARKLFHRPRDEQTNSSWRVDRIFDVHATNEEYTLHRRRTTEDLRRPMRPNISKLDISKPITSPPAPDEKLVHRYEKRQADWKKRSMSFKIKRLDSVKRWSWRTWKVQAGQEDIPNATSFTRSGTGETKRLLPRDPIREVEDVHGHGSFARERAQRVHELRAAGLEISIKPSANGAATLRDQRLNQLTLPAKLSVIKEQQSQPSLLHPTHCHAASATHFPRQYNLRNQGLTKSASTGMLRPGEMRDSHLDLPSLSRTTSANDQRHIHTTLRTQRSSNWGASDQRHVHPALRTQPSTTLRANDQRDIHPTPRNEPKLRPTAVNHRYIHPTLRAQPSTISTTSLNTINTTGSTPPFVHFVPRVRIIPPTPLIGPDGIPTSFAKRPTVASKPPPADEQIVLVGNINNSRAIVSAAPLRLDPLLSARAQTYVDLEIPPPPPPKSTTTVFRRHESLNLRQARHRATKIEQIPFATPSGASAIRLISPPGLGVLTCAELWIGGKYKRHKTVRPSHAPNQHRYTFLPTFVEDDTESTFSMVSSSHSHGHSRSNSEGQNHTNWCACAEYDAWKTVTDKRWKEIGIGCAKDGRWVVELWEPDSSGGAARSF
jgi:hypothetical protein